MTVIDFARLVRHRLFHAASEALIERAPGEVFLRCTVCGMRSVGWKTGPLKIRSQLPGDAARFRLVPPKVTEIAVPRSPTLVRSTSTETKMTVH